LKYRRFVERRSSLCATYHHHDSSSGDDPVMTRSSTEATVVDATSRIARLGKSVVDKAEPAAVRYTIWDDKLAGFGVRISPAGAKTYVARYRAGGGRAGQLRQMTLGRHGQLTADQARTAADKVISAATLGADPVADRMKARADITVAALCDLYFADGCTTKKASTLYTDGGRVKRHIVPLLGAKRVATVTRADVERFLADVAAGKTAWTEKTRARGKAVVQGGRGTATRTVGLLGAIFIHLRCPWRAEQASDRTCATTSVRIRRASWRPDKPRHRPVSPQARL
jgi:hypothetical protein